MTSYCHRITAGAGLSNRPIRLSRMTTSSSRTVEISRLPQNYCSNHHQQRSRMVLRSRKIIRAAAVGPCGDGEEKAAAAAGQCAYAVENLSSLTTEEEEEEKSESDQDRTAEMESEEEEENGEKKNKKMDQSQTVKVAVAAAVTVVMGVGNRVLYKLALVPLKQYPFFLAQLATFGPTHCRLPATTIPMTTTTIRVPRQSSRCPTPTIPIKSTIHAGHVDDPQTQTHEPKPTNLNP